MTKSKYCRDNLKDETCKKEDCPGCDFERPKLLNSNLEAWSLWNSVSTQWRMAKVRPIGLDYTALYQTAQIMHIEMNISMLRKIQALEIAYLDSFKEVGNSG